MEERWEQRKKRGRKEIWFLFLVFLIKLIGGDGMLLKKSIC